MDRDEKERFFANSGMPRLKTLTGKNIALFGLSANPPTGYQGYNVEYYRINLYIYACILLCMYVYFIEWTYQEKCLFMNWTGHSGIVRYLENQNLFSEIWILPVYQHMFVAKKGLIPFEHRMAMCKLCMEVSISLYWSYLFTH